jgi:adenylate cyclase
MASLAAHDLNERELVRHRWALAEGIETPLGRGRNVQLQTAWDASINEFHATLCWKEEGKLRVRRIEAGAPSPVFYNGEDREEFEIIPGEGFVIGQTVFYLNPSNDAKETPAGDFSATQFFPAEQLRSMAHDSDHLEAISQLLKHLRIRRLDIQSFQQQIVRTLRGMIKRADFVAILRVQDDKVTLSTAEGDLPFCQPLVVDVLRRQELVAHRWRAGARETYAAVKGVEWVVCAPVICNVEVQGDYAVYLAGSKAPAGNQLGGRPLPLEQLALISVVADILQTVRTMHELNAFHDSMQEFFPKPIRDPLLQHGPAKAFRTEQARASILFCDLRGSSRFAEETDLVPAWSRIKEALSVMTEAITNHTGCIGDFQGDAAMGFWGWPRQGTDEALLEHVRAACQAADTLRERFLQKSAVDGPLAGFGCGIGVASGSVIAGMLGTVDQRKIGVFGPAVNLAARLESMTKRIGASILLDEHTADGIKKTHADLSRRLREIALIQPAGMDTAIRVYELMPPAFSAGALTQAQVKLFNVGRADFEAGKWSEARGIFQRLAESRDGPSQFLLDQIEHLGSPPSDWSGRVVLASK